MDDTKVKSLEAKINTLLDLSEQMFEDNLRLKEEHLQWQEERAQLITKHDQARMRIKSMIDRLQYLEKLQS